MTIRWGNLLEAKRKARGRKTPAMAMPLDAPPYCIVILSEAKDLL
jgi:hypothetical protein